MKRLILLLAALLAFGAACSDDPSGNNGGTPDANIGDTDLDDGGGADAGDTSPDTDPDAGDAGDGGGPTGDVVSCDNTLPAAPEGRACAVTSGASNLVMLEGTVLAGNTVYENGQVLIDRSSQNATIACVGCDCGDEPDASTATLVSCADSVISPGLVNAHEHLGWATGSPKGHGDERFDHRHDWREGLRGHTEIRSGGSDYSSEAILFGELRHLLSGATSIAGSTRGGGSAGFARNLDNDDATGGINVSVDYSTFPLGDTRGTLISDGCGYGDIESDSVLGNDIYLPHISEGIDAEAQNEFTCLSASAGGGTDLIDDNTSVIHGIGLTAADIAEFAANGAELVWSPRTNIDLYGNTADVITYYNFGVTIALGTDWVISGSMNMTRELQCVDYLNQNHYGNFFTDQQIWKMATANGAKALGVGDKLGTIAEGYIADIAIYNATDSTGYRAVIDAGAEDVQLVMRGGEPVVGEPNIVQGMVSTDEIGQCESISICSGARLICAERDTGKTWSAIIGAAGGNYEPFYCDEPADEPSCVPFRPDEYTGMTSADDQDGDGVIDSEDTCPSIFNPMRPLDEAGQADFDNDGVGDSCDVCPLNEGETCEPFDPTDRDADGVPNDSDNCPAIANDAQTDTDSDDIGDVCDRCPDFANPGDTGCPATTYDIWSGSSSVGDSVLLQDVIVTAVNGTDAFFVQHPADSADYTDVPNSGIYIYSPGVTPMPARGDRIDVSATVGEYGGSLQLGNVDNLTVNSSGNDLPEPVVVEPEWVATGGVNAETYLNVLVRVDNVEVVDANPDAPNDYGEFAVDGDLRIDDLMYLVEPDPQVGDTFNAVVGPLVFSFGNSKIVPRDENDIILGPPVVTGISPQSAFLEAGATAVPTPGLSVELDRAPSADTTVDLTYSDSSILTGPASVTVLAGETSVDLSLEGVGTAGQSADVTASLNSTTATATVTLYDDATAREVSSLTPPTQDILVNQTGTMTVSLNVPAPAGGQEVALSATTGLTVPATVSVPAGQLSTDITVTAGPDAGSATVTATVGATSATADVNINAAPLIPCLIISEYIEGSSFNKALELYNCGTTDLDLANFGVCFVNNGGAECDNESILPAVTLAPGEVHTLCNSQASLTGITQNCTTQDNGVINHNGDDRFVIFEDTDASGAYEPANDTVTDAFGETAAYNSSDDPWKDATYRRCDFTSYDGQSVFDVTTLYSTHPTDDTADYGTAPTQGCL